MKKALFLIMALIGTQSINAEIRDVYLHGDAIGWTDQEEFKFEQVGNDENHYRLIATLPAPASGSSQKLKIYDYEKGENIEKPQHYRGCADSSDKEIDVNGALKSLNSISGTGSESSFTLTYRSPIRLCFDYWAKWKFSGDTDQKYHSALTVTTCPETLYLYGHLKGKGWDTGDFYASSSDNGVYKFTDVNISGRDGGENYIAFYGQLPTASNYGSLFPRYSGNKADKNTDSAHSNGDNVVILESDFNEDNDQTVSRKIDANLKEPAATSNFRLHDGMYDVTVDLPNGTVSFTKLDLFYSWMKDDGSLTDGQTIYIFIEDSHELSLAVRGNTEHEAVAKSNVKVSYNTGTNSGLTDAEEQEDEIILRRSNETDAWLLRDDNSILLKRPGTYTISAELDDAYSRDYLKLQPSSITAIVFDLPTGLSDVNVESNVPQYYNLQGQQVSRPVSKGIYIVKRGNKVTKEIL